MASPDQDESPKKQPSASGQESCQPDEESTPGGEQTTPKRRGKKRKREDKERKEVKKKKNATLTDSPAERPSRERKSVVRYAATAPRRLSATKAVTVPQGTGKKLKDIPNAAFKLSKRKSDESLKVLHKILFGRKTNVHFLKRNILQFSGFVWSQNEDKERSKVREKLSKCNKDRLLEYCDLLDVYTLKVTTKKEEISAKLLEFLECPQITRDVVLSEKDTKRKRGRKGVKVSGERPLEEASPDRENKKLKKGENLEAKKDHQRLAKADKEDPGKASLVDTDLGYEDKNDNAEETSEHSCSEEEDDEDNAHAEPESTKSLSDGEKMELHEEPKSKEKTPVVRKVSHARSKVVRSESAKKKRDIQGKPKVLSESKARKGSMGSSKPKKEKAAVKKDLKDNSSKKVSGKKGKPGSVSDLSSRPKKSNEKGKINEKEKSNSEPSRNGGKENKKRVAKSASSNMKEKSQISKTKPRNSTKKGKRDDSGPTREKLHAVVSDILQEVDFNVATLADIIKQLGAHFNTDLMHRKTEIKDILEEVINNMSEDEDAEDGDGNAEE